MSLTPTLNFRIDENYLIAHTLSSTNKKRFSSNKHKKDIVSFQNFAWSISKQKYLNLIKEYKPIEIKNPKDLSKKAQTFLALLKLSKQYKKILLQTQKYLLLCKSQWNKNLNHSSFLVRELTGIKMIRRFDVYISHPSLKNGMNLNGKILWGHNEDWTNYTTVYLWHEILHSYLSIPKNDRWNHAIIQLIADNELRIKLNGGAYPPFYGHKELFPLMRKILPLWKKYLKSQNKNILDFKHSYLQIL